MQNLGVAADMTSYNIILKSCCRASIVDLAQEIYREVQHLKSAGVLKLDDFTYSTIIKVFADAKMWLMTLEIKEDMLVAGVTPNTVTWSSLINACSSAGLVEKNINVIASTSRLTTSPTSPDMQSLILATMEPPNFKL